MAQINLSSCPKAAFMSFHASQLFPAILQKDLSPPESLLAMKSKVPKTNKKSLKMLLFGTDAVACWLTCVWCQHPVWGLVLVLAVPLAIQLPACDIGRQQRMAQVLGPLHLYG